VITDTEPVTTSSIVSGIRAHRPLFLLAAAMAVLAAIALVGLLLDSRTITGIPLWAKPLKFAISIAIYALTFGWLIGQLRRGRRVAWWAGTIAAALLTVEMVIIVGQALRVTTSHFNATTQMNETLYNVMGASIAAVWVATLVISIILFANPGPDRARTIAIRAGAAISVVGMALGFLMTIPSAAQIQADNGIVGAHTIGSADGGPGLPLLGWSTIGGDLRIPHFVGMHALQLLPLFLIMLEVLARRLRVLREDNVRAALMWIATATYTAIVALVTWQALRGQSIVAPDLLTLAAIGAIVAVSGVSSAMVLARGSRVAATIGPVAR